ncbi:hypothetical protein AMAG_20147 [Allomyces macrogynus ATCC 38327]|uniref:Uncharacterized protein n=1 Tax=Allomyces macrogynus (strain ATCC 38327) TaxID=578462 RepID=A0A0L0T5K3_ALLM3|nr:hypothetical protein AMAG_20147 [Allomyces macrogynus ATCC 38327]|eukprot:KNE69956.1 hypothetical protein AMAG_20147 [Allomyces macrogynus ATCC 38327]
MPHFPITVSHPYAHSHPYAPAHVAIPSPWAMAHHAHHHAYAPPVYAVPPPMHAAAPVSTGAADALARDLRAMLRIDVPMP